MNRDRALVARSWERGEQIECEAHVAALVAAKREAREHRGQDRLAHAAPSSVALLEQAASRGTPIKGLVRDLERLLEEYGAKELETGCAEALEREVPHANAVRQALERRREARGLSPPIAVRLPPNARVRGLVVRPVRGVDRGSAGASLGDRPDRRRLLPDARGEHAGRASTRCRAGCSSATCRRSAVKARSR